MKADTRTMTTWREFEDEAPELARTARNAFESTRHHVLATLRTDGAPRVSGTEVDIHGDHLTIGSMWTALKARDLQRDPRYALHTNPGDGEMQTPDVKVSGRAVEAGADEVAAYVEHAPGTPQPFHLFRMDVDEVVLAGINDTRTGMIIQLWRPGRAVQTFIR